MSAQKVDVLAVIDKDRAALAKSYGEVMAAHDGYLAEHDKMRAAIAELIEAVQPAVSDEGMTQDELTRLRAALARVGGEA